MYCLELEQIFNNEGSHLDIEHCFDMSDYSVGNAKPIQSPVKLVGQVKNCTGIVSILAWAEFEYSAECDRCAAPVSRNYRVPVEHILVTELNDENNDRFIVVPSMRLDLDALAYEDILLYLPSKFLCKEDCKGICPYCGCNLNEGSCNCKKPTNPCWDVLQQLLDE